MKPYESLTPITYHWDTPWIFRRRIFKSSRWGERFWS